MTVLGRAAVEAHSLAVMARAGMLPLTRPDRLLGSVSALRRYGAFGGAAVAAAINHGTRPAIIDERGTLTFTELNDAVNRLADVLGAEYAPGTTIGLLCRNHRTPLIVAMAASRAGLNAMWLNTGFSPRQTAEVTAAEGVAMLVRDADLAHLVSEVEVPTVQADIAAPSDEVTALIARGRPVAPPAPPTPGRIVLLTSGTTGTPKGAPRPDPRGYSLPGSFLERMPLRSREVTVIGPPLFHGTGLAFAILGLGLGSTIVLRRGFDPQAFVDDLIAHRASAACVVPVMLQRVVALPGDSLAAAADAALRVVFCSGAALPGSVSAKFQDHFGEVIYNLYGSTEVAVGTIATPTEVRDHPSSVGKPALGSRVRVLDDAGKPVPVGVTGRIFVGTLTPFEGYTGGGDKERIGGLLATGDVGHFDQSGRLYIDGRDDEMIVSGGENVFPAEVEDLLAAHPDIREAAAIGVPDEEFGQRLHAFVVPVAGRPITEDEVREHVRANLARYKIPRDVTFLDELPRNATGKVVKRLLP